MSGNFDLKLAHRCGNKKLNVDLHVPGASLPDWLVSMSPGEKLPKHGMLCLEGDEE